MGVVAEHRTEIDGTTYTTETFPATDGIDVGHLLTKTLGSGVLRLILELDDDDAAELLENVAKGAIDHEALKAMAVAFISVAEGAAVGELSSMLKTTLARTKFVPAQDQAPTPVSLHFDDHFAGRYMHLGKVFVWVVRVSFARP